MSLVTLSIGHKTIAPPVPTAPAAPPPLPSGASVVATVSSVAHAMAGAPADTKSAVDAPKDDRVSDSEFDDAWATIDRTVTVAGSITRLKAQSGGLVFADAFAEKKFGVPNTASAQVDELIELIRAECKRSPVYRTVIVRIVRECASAPIVFYCGKNACSFVDNAAEWTFDVDDLRSFPTEPTRPCHVTRGELLMHVLEERLGMGAVGKGYEKSHLACLHPLSYQNRYRRERGLTTSIISFEVEEESKIVDVRRTQPQPQPPARPATEPVTTATATAAVATVAVSTTVIISTAATTAAGAASSASPTPASLRPASSKDELLPPAANMLLLVSSPKGRVVDVSSTREQLQSKALLVQSIGASIPRVASPDTTHDTAAAAKSTAASAVPHSAPIPIASSAAAGSNLTAIRFRSRTPSPVTSTHAGLGGNSSEDDILALMGGASPLSPVMISASPSQSPTISPAFHSRRLSGSISVPTGHSNASTHLPVSLPFHDADIKTSSLPGLIPPIRRPHSSAPPPSARLFIDSEPASVSSPPATAALTLAVPTSTAPIHFVPPSQPTAAVAPTVPPTDTVTCECRPPATAIDPEKTMKGTFLCIDSKGGFLRLRGIELLKVSEALLHASYDPTRLCGGFRYERRNLNAHCDAIISKYIHESVSDEQLRVLNMDAFDIRLVTHWIRTRYTPPAARSPPPESAATIATAAAAAPPAGPSFEDQLFALLGTICYGKSRCKVWAMIMTRFKLVNSADGLQRLRNVPKLLATCEVELKRSIDASSMPYALNWRHRVRANPRIESRITLLRESTRKGMVNAWSKYAGSEPESVRATQIAAVYDQIARYY